MPLIHAAMKYKDLFMSIDKIMSTSIFVNVRLSLIYQQCGDTYVTKYVNKLYLFVHQILVNKF